MFYQTSTFIKSKKKRKKKTEKKDDTEEQYTHKNKRQELCFHTHIE
jgi:hypothetical protein